MEEKLSLWLRNNYPRDILMPLEKGVKRPSFPHKNESWSWYRYITSHEGGGDVGILLIDLCVIDVDCHSVADALEERFEILKAIPCEETTNGRHYYLSRSKKADVEGFYDSVKPKNARIDFKSRCSNGTSGVVAVAPSTGKMWRKDRAPWECFPNGKIPKIPDALLEHVGRARHTPISCSLHFLVDGEVRHVESCNLMAGSAYIDIFVRDPLDSIDSDSRIVIPVPNWRATTFDEMLYVCACGELCLTQAEVMDSSPEEFRRRITMICELADFFGMPTRFDTVFRAPYGYLWACVRLHELSRRLNAVSIVESVWRYRLGTCEETETGWKNLVVEVTPEFAKRIRYKPIQAPRDSFLFYKRKSMTSLFDAGAATIRSDPEDIELPPIISKILGLACGRLMLAGGSLLGKVAIMCSRGADYDFFFFGIDAQHATRILENIMDLPDVSELHRSEHAITFGANDSIFQVITRLFRNPAEILHGFDISACKIGLFKDEIDRAHLLATPSWVESMRHRAIWVDERTWSRSSAVRLCKYYCKGFDVLIPGLLRDALDKGIDLRRDLDTFDGITLLFALEHQLDKQYDNKRDIRARIALTWLEKMVLTRMKRHRDCDYTTFMKTTKFLHSLWNWFSSKNIRKLHTQPVLVWSTPRTGKKVCGTFAQCPSNLKDILLL